MNKKKITAFIMFGVLALFIVGVGIFGNDFVFSGKSKETTYEALGFSFKSNNYLYETKVQNFGIAFEGLFHDIAVLGNKDSKSNLESLGYEDLTLESYAMLSHESNGKNPTELLKSENGKYYFYTYVAGDTKDEFFYLCTIYESDDYFYLVNFACKKNEQEEYKDTFIKWADSVVIKNN